MTKTPKTFHLHQNFPNPFNPTTTIRYILPARCHVQLIVFNALGEEVATLVDEEEDPGKHEISFDGSSLSAGVYFYRLVAEDYVATKKLIVLE